VDPMDEASLLEICNKYGEIEKSPLIVKQNKGSLAYAIVAFKSSESAQLAIEGLIGDYGLQVDYAITRKNPVSYSKVSDLSNNNNN
jgi:RNA recognition motif-containing protein